MAEMCGSSQCPAIVVFVSVFYINPYAGFRQKGGSAFGKMSKSRFFDKSIRQKPMSG